MRYRDAYIGMRFKVMITLELGIKGNIPSGTTGILEKCSKNISNLKIKDRRDNEYYFFECRIKDLTFGLANHAFRKIKEDENYCLLSEDDFKI